MKQIYTIIGLGAFGSTVARELARLGHDVIGIDRDPQLVNDIAEDITQAVTADASDEQILRELGVHESAVVVIAIGENMMANILTTLIIKGMNKPKVWVKAFNPQHHQILLLLGADHIVHPEHEMGLRLAHIMLYPEVMDYINLGDDQFTVELRVSPHLAGNTLAQLELAANHLQCLLIKRAKIVTCAPPHDHVLQENDQIVLLGSIANLRKITSHL